MKCLKCQKIVRNGETVYRCLNPRCSAHRQLVTLDACDKCDNAVVKHKKPCAKPVPAAEPEMEAKQFPKATIQLWEYKEALMRWQKAGRPTRSKEEVDRIHIEHCSKCDWYDKEVKRCRGCGCRVTTGALAIFNKIKMATEHCPKDLW